jgi:hypothetical protein
MNRIRAFTTDIAGRTRQAAPVSDMHPARPMSARVDVFNVLPPRKPAAPKRINLDAVSATLTAIAASLRSKPKATVEEAVEYQPPERPSFQQQLAEMNKRNYEYWFGAKR